MIEKTPRERLGACRYVVRELTLVRERRRPKMTPQQGGVLCGRFFSSTVRASSTSSAVDCAARTDERFRRRSPRTMSLANTGQGGRSRSAPRGETGSLGDSGSGLGAAVPQLGTKRGNERLHGGWYRGLVADSARGASRRQEDCHRSRQRLQRAESSHAIHETLDRVPTSEGSESASRPLPPWQNACNAPRHFRGGAW